MLIYSICIQYLVGAPFALITASIRCGMEVISLWHCWGGMALINEFHNLSWITEINELFHDILIYWDAPVHRQREKEKRLGYVCNPRSLKEGTETSRRRTDELGYRLERPIHFECKLNEPMHIGMRLLHPAAADHSVSINRQQVQRIFRFSLRSRAGDRPLSGGTGAVATGRDVSVPSFRERGLHT